MCIRDRWMKVRHMPTALRHHPLFVVRNARRMMAHTFRGTTWRSLVGLESSRDSFRRYRQIRARERQYLDWPDPLADAPSPPRDENRAVNAPLHWVGNS